MSARAVVFDLTLDGASGLRVTEFHATERLSEGFSMRVTAAGAEGVDLDAVVGRDASLSVLRGDGQTRVFHGVVRAASVASTRHGLFVVRLEIASRVERLKLGRECRIFQKKSVPDIVKQVLRDAGVSNDAQSWQLSASYAPRDYVTQYNESDWDFVARLLVAEGIGFLVRHGADAEQVVFFDDDAAWLDVEGTTTVLVDRDATQLSEDVVWELRDARRGVSDAVVLRDEDSKRPSMDLTASATAEGSAGREVYDHPGGYTEMGVGRRLAQRRLDRLRVGARTVTGQSDCAFLEPGRRFTIAECPRTALDADYVVWACEHRGLVGSEGAKVLYENRFEALPRTVVFRPRLDVRAPVAGVLVAFVTAQPGEEIHVDERGRAKVRFPWDRAGITDARSSTWLRVGQLFLGGSMVLPRCGYEVLVDVERADLDRPLVTGHLYNGEARPPYGLPASATRSSIQSATYTGGPGANELRFEDAAGGEEIYLNASKDLVVSTEHDARWQVNHNESVKVGSNRSLKVGSNRARSVTSNRALTVDGDLSLDVKAELTEVTGGSESLSIGGMRLGKVGGDLTENTTGTLSRSVASLQSVTGLAGVARKVTGNLTTRVAGAWIQMSGGSVASNCKGARIELTGALKFVKAKTMTVECGAAYIENVASMSVKTGGGRADEAMGAVLISAGGGLSVKAATINIEAKSRLVINAGGCVIQLSSSGSVKVRAANIDLRGAKGINQVTHSTN